MPMPIAHSAAGIAGYIAFRKNNPGSPPRQELLLLCLCAFLAIAPDLDFIPGFLYGKPGRFHHGPSHSIVISLLITFVCYASLRTYLNLISKKRIFSCFIFALLSHPVLDYFSEDTSIPFGIPLLWPFNFNYFISPLSLFQDVQRVDSTVVSFFSSLLNANNGLGVVVESLFAGIILFALCGLKNYSNPLRSFPCFLISMVCGVLYYFIQIRPYLL